METRTTITAQLNQSMEITLINIGEIILEIDQDHLSHLPERLQQKIKSAVFALKELAKEMDLKELQEEDVFNVYDAAQYAKMHNIKIRHAMDKQLNTKISFIKTITRVATYFPGIGKRVMPAGSYLVYQGGDHLRCYGEEHFAEFFKDLVPE